MSENFTKPRFTYSHLAKESFRHTFPFSKVNSNSAEHGREDGIEHGELDRFRALQSHFPNTIFKYFSYLSRADAVFTVISPSLIYGFMNYFHCP